MCESMMADWSSVLDVVDSLPRATGDMGALCSDGESESFRFG